MKKLVVFSGGLVAIGSAALVGTGFMGSGVAMSQPNYNVVGEPYNKALQILKQQGIKAYFGGSFGSELPQARCLVDQQKITSGGRMLLMLDCSQKAVDQIAEMGPAGGPTVGANGITVVTPMPVVPIQGAPGAGAPPPA